MMKPVYIDITNIPELERYTGISRVVTEVVSHLVRDGADVRLMAYSVPDHAYKLIDRDHFISALNGDSADKSNCYTDTLVVSDEFEEDSIFFELNSSWHTLPNRSWLLPRLKNRHIRIVCLIYDLIPIKFPQYMVGQTLVRFMEFLTAHMIYADDIIVTADAVKDDLETLFGQLGLTPKSVTKVRLGADFSAGGQSADAGEVSPDIKRIAEGRKFLLSVGTVEPRKNQKLLIDAYEAQLADMGLDLVIVGRIGWDMDELMERIKSNPNYGRGLHVLSGVDDADLKYLYSKAFMVVFPSFTEGYGLPTIESLINGVPVACSDIGVMREVGGDFADYFDPHDADSLCAAVRKYADDPARYDSWKKHIIEDYKPPVWADTAAAFEKLFFGEEDFRPFEHKPVKQIVFLSARPAPILATLPYIEEFMPFITELVVCCPDSMADFMKENYKGRLALTTVTDGELLAGRALPPDHSTRNFFLRCLAMELDILDDEFIMSDDDYRPLGPISEDFFYSEGKYRGYYFSDISRWKYLITALFSYDHCHFRTLGFLKSHGYPTLQYSSHMPQIINRRWYLEMLKKYPNIRTKGYDEWSVYFNYISAEHREEFQPCPYVTLSWPPVGGEPKGVVQPEYVFENFYSENYGLSKPFSGCSSVFTNVSAVLDESKRKIGKAAEFRDKFAADRSFADTYANEHEEKYGYRPDISAYFCGEGDNVPDLGCPETITLSRTRANYIRFSVARASLTEANIANVVFELCVTDKKGKPYYSGAVEFTPHLEYSHAYIKLLPDAPPEGLRLRVAVRLKTRSVTAERIVPVVIAD